MIRDDDLRPYFPKGERVLGTEGTRCPRVETENTFGGGGGG